MMGAELPNWWECEYRFCGQAGAGRTYNTVYAKARQHNKETGHVTSAEERHRRVVFVPSGPAPGADTQEEDEREV